MKVALTLLKTIEAETTSALDVAYAAFVQTLTEEQFVSASFDYISGSYVAFIVYTR